MLPFRTLKKPSMEMPQPQILPSKACSTAKQTLLGQDQWCQLDPKGVSRMGLQLPKTLHGLDLTAMGEETPAHCETAITLETGSHTDHCSSKPHKEERCLGKLLWLCRSRLAHCSLQLSKFSHLGFAWSQVKK